MLCGLNLWLYTHGLDPADWPGRARFFVPDAPLDRETIPLLTVGFAHAVNPLPAAAVGSTRPAREDRDRPGDPARTTQEGGKVGGRGC